MKDLTKAVQDLANKIERENLENSVNWSTISKPKSTNKLSRRQRRALKRKINK